MAINTLEDLEKLELARINNLRGSGKAKLPPLAELTPNAKLRVAEKFAKRNSKPIPPENSTGNGSVTEVFKSQSAEAITADTPIPVPQMSDVSPLRTEPVIEVHVTNSQTGHTSPPNPEPVMMPGAEPFNGDIGGANVFKDAPPPMPGEGDTFIPASGQIPGQPTGIIAGNPQGASITEKQAQEAFDQGVKQYNHLMTQGVGKWIGIKARKFNADLKNAPEDLKQDVLTAIKNYNDENTELLKLNADDIEMLRDPAVAVLQEEGIGLTPRQRLIIAGIQVGLKKAEIIAMIAVNVKKTKAEISQYIIDGLSGMASIKAQADRILEQARRMEAESKAREENAFAMMEQLRFHQNNGGGMAMPQTKRRVESSPMINMKPVPVNISKNGHAEVETIEEEVPIPTGFRVLEDGETTPPGYYDTFYDDVNARMLTNAPIPMPVLMPMEKPIAPIPAVIPDGYREVKDGEIVQPGDYHTHLNTELEKTITNAPTSETPDPADDTKADKK